MKEIEKILKKIKKQMKDKDAHYLYGVEYSDDSKPRYQAVIRFSKAIAPLVAAGKSEKEVKESLESFLKGEEAKDVNIRYHEGFIDNLKSAVIFHEKMIDEYKEKGEADEHPSS